MMQLRNYHTLNFLFSSNSIFQTSYPKIITLKQNLTFLHTILANFIIHTNILFPKMCKKKSFKNKITQANKKNNISRIFNSIDQASDRYYIYTTLIMMENSENKSLVRKTNTYILQISLTPEQHTNIRIFSWELNEYAEYSQCISTIPSSLQLYFCDAAELFEYLNEPTHYHIDLQNSTFIVKATIQFSNHIQDVETPFPLEKQKLSESVGNLWRMHALSSEVKKLNQDIQTLNSNIQSHIELHQEEQNMRVASDKTKFWILFAIFFVIYLILYYLVERVHSLEKKVLLC